MKKFIKLDSVTFSHQVGRPTFNLSKNSIILPTALKNSTYFLLLFSKFPKCRGAKFASVLTLNSSTQSMIQIYSLTRLIRTHTRIEIILIGGHKEPFNRQFSHGSAANVATEMRTQYTYRVDYCLEAARLHTCIILCTSRVNSRLCVNFFINHLHRKRQSHRLNW